jgi:hypothetical protein
VPVRANGLRATGACRDFRAEQAPIRAPTALAHGGRGACSASVGAVGGCLRCTGAEVSRRRDWRVPQWTVKRDSSREAPYGPASETGTARRRTPDSAPPRAARSIRGASEPRRIADPRRAARRPWREPRSLLRGRLCRREAVRRADNWGCAACWRRFPVGRSSEYIRPDRAPLERLVSSVCFLLGYVGQAPVIDRCSLAAPSPSGSSCPYRGCARLLQTAAFRSQSCVRTASAHSTS